MLLPHPLAPGPSPALARPTARLRRALVALACLALLATGVAVAEGLLVPDEALPADPIEQELLDATNRARSRLGLPPLAADERLAQAARHHAYEMAAFGYLGHVSPTPESATLLLRLGRSGAPHTGVAENLAVVRGESDPARAAVDGWLGSPGHRRNLLDARFDRIGFGVGRADDGSIYVAQVLADVPRELLGAELDRTDVALYGLELELELAPTVGVPTDLLLAVDSATGRLIRTADRVVRLETTVPDDPVSRVRIGVRDARGSYVLAAALHVDPARGTVSPDPAASDGRIVLRRAVISAPEVAARRLVLRYAPGDRDLALVVDGRHRPAASIGDGRLELVLPGGLDRDLLVGHVDDDGRIDVFHAFRLRWDGGEPHLLAGRSDP